MRLHRPVPRIERIEHVPHVDRTTDRTRHTPASHMLPDADGTLQVLARCQVHFTRQPKADVWAGIEAACMNKQCKVGR